MMNTRDVEKFIIHNSSFIIYTPSFIITKKGFQVRTIPLRNQTKNHHFHTLFANKIFKFYYDGRFESTGRIAREPHD